MLAMGYVPYEPHKCEVHEKTVSFRAKSVAEERKDRKPYAGTNIEEIRQMWRDFAGIKDDEVKDNV